MKKKHVIMLAAVVAAVIFIVIFYRPVPLISEKSAASAQIGLLRINYGGDSHHTEFVGLTDYNEQALLDYLSTCRVRRRSLFDEEWYRSLNDYTVEIVLIGTDGPWWLWLGKENNGEGDGKKYLFVDDDTVLVDVLSILDVKLEDSP